MNKHGGYYGTARNVIDFSVNLNPLGIPKSVKDRIPLLLEKLENYPELTCEDARTRLAIFLNYRNRVNGVDSSTLKFCPEHLILGNGATELIYLFARSIKPKRVMLIQPTFNEYERAFKQVGSECIYFQLTADTQFELPVQDFIYKIRTVKPEVVMICNPNNPTSSKISSEDLELILKVLKEYNGILCLDESFAEFELQHEVIRPDENIFRIRSMTKYYAIAGIRLGYGIGSESIIHKLEAFKEPWTLNALALEILPWLLEDMDYVSATGEWYEREKNIFYEGLSTIPGITLFPGYANFVLCRSTINGSEISRLLIEKGIFIRTCEDFIGLDDRYIRLAIKNHEQNDYLIKTLQKIMEEKGIQ